MDFIIHDFFIGFIYWHRDNVYKFIFISFKGIFNFK